MCELLTGFRVRQTAFVDGSQMTLFGYLAEA